MDESSKGSKEFDLQQLFKPLLLLLLTALFVQQLPLSGRRPAADKDRPAPLGIKVDARLWADPFDAPRRDSLSSDPHVTGLADFGGQIAAHVTDPTGSRPVVFLGVMLDGGPYAENVESRRRTRYAVISGLSVSGYEPEDPEHLRYLRFPDPYRLYDPWQKRVLSRDERQFPEVVPYEWFLPARHSGVAPASDTPAVLVLWLDESDLGARPLEKLGVLYTQLRLLPLKSLYRCPQPDPDVGTKWSCRPSARPSLVEEQVNAVLNELTAAGGTGSAQSATWRDLQRFLSEPEGMNDDSAASLSSYLRFLPLARSMEERSRPVDARDREIAKLTDFIAPIRADGSKNPGEPQQSPQPCELANDSLLFPLLGLRATGFIDALAARMKTAAAASSCVVESPHDAKGPLSPLFDGSNYRFEIVGPASSGQLSAMIRNLRELPAQVSAGGRNRQVPVRFFSAMASADEGALIDRSGADGHAASISELFARWSIPYYRALVPDDRLAAAIRDELERRGIPAASRENPIVLISEWDNTYAQMLRTTFCEKLYSPYPGDHPAAGNSVQYGLCRKFAYSYLRGIDGEGAPRPVGVASETSARGAGAALDRAMASGAPTELSFGDDQMDYLSRIAEDIASHDADLRRGSPSGAIRAIGLLGSDVYDKLMILRVLRKHFHDVLFFTTDLDARLLGESGAEQVTRNLVIASSYGLQLRNSLQKDIPPFRSSHQTAYFLATQMAVGDLNEPLGPGWLQQAASGYWLEPRLFEVGRSRFIPLVQPDSTDRLRAACGSVPACLSQRENVTPLVIRPESSAPIVWRLGAVLLIVLATAGAWHGAGFHVTRSPHRTARVSGLGRIGYPALATGALAAALAYAAWCSEEPLDALQGVSIWPTEFVRLAAFAMVLLYFWPNTVRWLDAFRADITTRGLVPASVPPWPSRTVLDCLRSTRFWLAILVTGGALLGLQVSSEFPGIGPVELLAIPAVLAACALGENLSHRIWRLPNGHADDPAGLTGRLHDWFVDSNHDRRVVVFMFGFIAVSMALMVVSGLPYVPYRGTVAKWADRIVLDSIVIAFQGMTALVIEAVRLSCQYLRQLDRISEAAARRDGVSPDGGPTLHWTVIQLAGLITRHANRLIGYPFIVATLLVLSRVRLFDDWSFPLGLSIVFALCFGFLLAAAWTMRREAYALRRGVLDRVMACDTQVEGGDLRSLVPMVEAYREGAYAPLLQRPVFRGLLLLVTGGSAEFLFPLLINLF
ncbi:MAG: hypothetical protein U1E83_03620 [Methylotetracoccus sp.]